MSSRRLRRYRWLLCVAPLLAGGPAATENAAASPELAAGRQVVESICAACHGLDGRLATNAESLGTPVVAGQKKLYLVNRLKDYRSGKLEHAQMSAIARGLDDDAIENTAEWYARVKVESPWFTQEAAMGMVDDSDHPAMTEERRAGKVKASQVCANCHGLYGQSLTAGNSAVVPNLTAQRKEFIIGRLRDFRSGQRQSGQMNFIASMLSDDDIDNVAEWYAGIDVTVIDPRQEMAVAND